MKVVPTSLLRPRQEELEGYAEVRPQFAADEHASETGEGSGR